MTTDRETEEHGVAVCVCTYRRPAQLSRLLDSMKTMIRPSSTFFVIVDNDGTDPGIADRVRDFRDACDATVEFVIEREPGISAARNAAFAAARSRGARFVAMLDDDEWVSPAWLAKLLETRRATGAGVVGGPVQPVFSVGSIPEKYAGLWSVQKGTLRARPYVYCTCNCLVALAAAAPLGERPFAPEFGLSGGEDVVFFRRLFFAGVGMAWSDAAVLYEEVDADRGSMAWMRRRWYRHGNVGVRCERAAPDPNGIPPAFKTALLCARLLVYPLFNRKAFNLPLLWVLESEKVRGRLTSHLGMVFAEYKRHDLA